MLLLSIAAAEELACSLTAMPPSLASCATQTARNKKPYILAIIMVHTQQRARPQRLRSQRGQLGVVAGPTTTLLFLLIPVLGIKRAGDVIDHKAQNSDANGDNDSGGGGRRGIEIGFGSTAAAAAYPKATPRYVVHLHAVAVALHAAGRRGRGRWLRGR